MLSLTFLLVCKKGRDVDTGRWPEDVDKSSSPPVLKPTDTLNETGYPFTLSSSPYLSPTCDSWTEGRREPFGRWWRCPYSGPIGRPTTSHTGSRGRFRGPYPRFGDWWSVVIYIPTRVGAGRLLGVPTRLGFTFEYLNIRSFANDKIRRFQTPTEQCVVVQSIHKYTCVWQWTINVINTIVTWLFMTWWREFSLCANPRIFRDQCCKSSRLATYGNKMYTKTNFCGIDSIITT